METMIDGFDVAAGRKRAAILRAAFSALVCAFVCIWLLHPRLAECEEPPIAVVIRGIVDAGRQPLLRRADFSDRQDLVRQLYERASFRPLWLHDDRPTQQAAELLRALSEADRRGLSPEDYDAQPLREAAARFGSASPPGADDAGAFDTALTICVLRFVTDMHFGRVAPSAVGFPLEMKTPELDTVAAVSELAGAAAPVEMLAKLDPQGTLFGRLVTALTDWRELAARSDFPEVPKLPKLYPGAADAGVSKVRDLLRALGDLPSTAPTPKDLRVYDPELVKAVKRFQARQALGADGIIGAATLSQLQMSPARRVRQIELALERLRWLPPPAEDTFVVVNLPEFQLRAYDRNAPGSVLQLRAVIGSASRRHETPVLHATMRYVVFRPYWDVPPTIAQKEILPDLERDPAYFSTHNYEFHNGRIRQRPGPDNALGLLKFVFPNPFHVYMHDTPSKRLFAKSRRDFSHGCIRVSDAAALAEFVLRGQGKWDRDAIDAAMTSGRNNHRVYLKRPLGVYLLYHTVAVDEDGTTHFFEDIYGHDARLDILLAKGPPYPYPIPTPTRVETESESESE